MFIGILKASSLNPLVKIPRGRQRYGLDRRLSGGSLGRVRTMQLYGTGAATATSVAQVTIPVAARIRGVQVSILVDATADNSSVRLELSKVPTNQIATNGAQDAFLEVGHFTNLGAAGADSNSLSTFIPLDVQCRAGEIIYLHATVVTATYYANFIFVY